MATSKRNLSDLLRQEAKQDRSATAPEAESSTATEQTTDDLTADLTADLTKLTKAQLLKHIEQLQSQQTLAPVPPNKPTQTDDSALVAKNQALTEQVKALEAKIAEQEQAIAKAEGTIKTLKADASKQESDKEKLERALGKQQTLVDQLQAQIQTLEAQQQAKASQERTIEQDKALVLAKISSYQVNLQFPTQPTPSISPEDIGWFD
jgi:chromosome segregation ATPase